MTIMVDWVWIEGVVAGLGWGVLIGGVLGMRFLERLASEGPDDEGGGK